MNTELREPWLDADRDLDRGGNVGGRNSPTMKVSTLAQRFNDITLGGDFDEAGMQQVQRLQSLLTELETKDLQRQKQLAEFQVRQADRKVTQAGEFEADVGKRKEMLLANQDKEITLQKRNEEMSLRLLRLLATRDQMQNETTMLEQERHASEEEMQTIRERIEHTRNTKEQIDMEAEAISNEVADLSRKASTVREAEDTYEHAKDSEANLQLEEDIGKQRLQLEKDRAEAQFRVVQAEEELVHFQSYMQDAMRRYTQKISHLNEKVRLAKSGSIRHQLNGVQSNLRRADVSVLSEELQSVALSENEDVDLKKQRKRKKRHERHEKHVHFD